MIMNKVSTRFYKPRLAELTLHELAYINSHIDRDKDIDFSLPTKLIVDTSDFEAMVNRPFQMLYNFSWGIRRNRFPLIGGKGKGTYGDSGLSFRLLYEMLCKAFNYGNYFIDDYFKLVFPHRQVGKRFFDAETVLKKNMSDEFQQWTADLPRRKDGVTPDMRYAKKGFRLADFRLWKNASVRAEYAELAEEIRRDIIVCMSTGKLVLRGGENAEVSSATMKARKRLGGMKSWSRLFYASGQLIEHMNIFINIAGDAA
jgi:hypothetical protein